MRYKLNNGLVFTGGSLPKGAIVEQAELAGLVAGDFDTHLRMGTFEATNDAATPNAKDAQIAGAPGNVAPGLVAATHAAPSAPAPGNDELDTLNKMALQQVAEEEGVEFTPKTTNAQLIELIRNKREGQEDVTDGDVDAEE